MVSKYICSVSILLNDWLKIANIYTTAHMSQAVQKRSAKDNYNHRKHVINNTLRLQIFVYVIVFGMVRVMQVRKL